MTDIKRIFNTISDNNLISKTLLPLDFIIPEILITPPQVRPLSNGSNFITNKYLNIIDMSNLGTGKKYYNYEDDDYIVDNNDTLRYIISGDITSWSEKKVLELIYTLCKIELDNNVTLKPSIKINDYLKHSQKLKNEILFNYKWGKIINYVINNYSLGILKTFESNSYENLEDFKNTIFKLNYDNEFPDWIVQFIMNDKDNLLQFSNIVNTPFFAKLEYLSQVRIIIS